ncbi:MAG: hypothetical protein ACHQT9_02660 [Candidatus Saccharimonadales bacterium]
MNPNDASQPVPPVPPSPQLSPEPVPPQPAQAPTPPAVPPQPPLAPQPPPSPLNEPPVALAPEGSIISPGASTPHPSITTPQPAPQAIVGQAPPPQVIGSDMSAMPTVGDMAPQYPNSVSSSSSPQAAGKGRKGLLIGLSGVFVFIIVGSVVFLLLSIINSSIKYSKNDLVPASGQNYSISYPKQWTDVSTNSKLLSKIGALDSGFNDLKAYAYKVNLKTNQAQSVLLAADTSDGVSDSDLSSSLQDPATKAKFTSLITPSLTAKDESCSSLTNKSVNVSYTSAPYVVKETVGFDCVPIDAPAGSNTLYHDQGFVAIKNGFVFVFVLSTQESDWKANQAFYTNDLLSSLQVK